MDAHFLLFGVPQNQILFHKNSTSVCNTWETKIMASETPLRTNKKKPNEQEIIFQALNAIYKP